ncbi:AAA family ATPase [Natronolimnobius sp. AArcel1]|uniref:Cdc6/Cdc18 family protein n=1 Tax=Natronolimnobius sp. AArcel1 TaxID=1679093 RepID=UPI0013EDAB17|nr:AAA family ATPase [Natronolimnobius sp. AArcel1]NGM67806.1 AAA family ATPase [Natronolimnobius sp. AArcel1]
MNVRERIARRRSAHQDRTIVVDRDHLSPTVHRQEPIGRGPVFEDLLDVLEPVFNEHLPDPVAVVGPAGSGTSAIVTALFTAMNEHFGATDRAIGTTTRSTSMPVTWFVTVDARRVNSPFALYRTLLEAVSSEPVPTSGVGTDDLRTRLVDRLERHDRRAVIAIDHHDEPETLSYDRVITLLEPVAASVAVVAVGQEPPPEWTGATVSMPAYRHHELVDVVTDRTSSGLAPGALEHESIRTLADWADGNAHDALATLFGAAVLAMQDDANRIEASHLEQAHAAVPDNGVHIDRALALSETRQRVLAHLIEIDAADQPVRELAATIADQSSLTESTVTRLLYELADRGVLERVPLPSDGSGRRPSTLEPRIPTIPFRVLSEARLE